jgi:GntR family transcriptional regulator
MPVSISIDRGSPIPAYRQIVYRVATAVAAGRLVEGENLPAVRVLAETLALNPNTVAHAYSELCGGGIIESRGTRGMFVAPRRQIHTKPARRRRIEPTLTHLVAEALLLGFDPGEIHDLLEAKLEEISRPPHR